MSHGFPNLSNIAISQNGVTYNYTHIMEMMAGLATKILVRARLDGATTVEGSAEAEQN